jgi:hypothetical protein
MSLLLLFQGASLALAALNADGSAQLSLASSSSAVVLAQADANATLSLSSSAAAVAPIGAVATAPLTLFSLESASDPVQSIESAPLVLQSSSDTSVLVQADASALVSIATAADAITAIITADADALLAIQGSSDVHNDAPVLLVGGGSFHRKHGRERTKPVPELPPRQAWITVGLALTSESSALAPIQGDAQNILSLSANSVAVRGPDPMEALLFLIAA